MSDMTWTGAAVSAASAANYDMDGVHAALRDILVEIDRICRRHDIRYSVYCGTLLGMVRHGDFIPWDDDADLQMPLADYRRFVKAARTELSDRFVMQDTAAEPRFFQLWTRIRKKGTTSMFRSMAALDIHQGIFVDIYPMIGASDSRIGFAWQRFALPLARALRSGALWRVKGCPAGTGAVRLAGFITHLPRFICIPVSRLLLLSALRDPDKCRMCCTLDAAPFDRKFERGLWMRLTEGQLGGIALPMPASYDSILTRMYGDYMQLPPVEQRTVHTASGDLILDPSRDYTEYKKELLAPDAAQAEKV